jgi:beta-glucosidase
LDTALPQAVRALAGYEKVALRPGESRRVTIELPARQLESWNRSTHGWELGIGPRSVWVGGSSSDLPLRTTVRVRGH